MGLEKRSGSKWWYGSYTVDGERLCVNLGLRIVGEPGQQQFIASEARAQAKLDKLISESRERQSSVEMLKKLHEIRTGKEIGSIELSAMAVEWEGRPRARTPSAQYAKICRSRADHFAKYFAQHHPKVTHMHQVSFEMAENYMAYQEERGLTGKSYNEVLKHLRSMFRHLRRKAGLTENPFEDVPRKEEVAVPRKPFSIEELHAIFEEVKADEFLRPLIVTAVCTAMRRGDCCLLKWADVDMEGGFITVKTSKTGETVLIPIFPQLLEELRQRPRDGEYVFPKAAEIYQSNPDDITQRVKNVIARALMPAEDRQQLRQLQSVTVDEVRERGIKYLDNLALHAREARKARKMKEVFMAYLDGATLKESAAKAAVSVGSAHNHLRSIGDAIHLPVVRTAPSLVSRPANFSEKTQVKRQGAGLRRGSTMDFHSFRVTWVTLALSAGVPMELVRRVTGHTTADIVLKHYFKPGKDELRRTLQLALPNLLPRGPDGVPMPVEQSGPVESLDRAMETLRGQTARNWQYRRDEALEYIASARKSLDQPTAGYAGAMLHLPSPGH